MKTLTGIASVIYLISIYFISNYCDQSQFSMIFGVYSISFATFIYLVLQSKQVSFKFLLGLGILVRVLLIFSFPNLSDDIYRFYWDGILWWSEVHPFDFLPSELMNLEALPDVRLKEIYPLLNSPEYYTIYPPFCQALFSLSANLGTSIESSSIILKSFYFLGDMMAVGALIQLLKRFELPSRLSLLYFLNPMIILELIGNIHAEVWMVCFLLWMSYFLMDRKYWLAGILYSLAISSKILPLMFGPLILVYLWKKKEGVGFMVSAALSLILFFGLMLYGSNVQHLLSSINLYFQSFEFNASFYYFFRWLGYLKSGYNQIAFIGPGLAILSLLVILGLSWQLIKNKMDIDRNLLITIALIFCVFLLGSTTIHPWYLSLPLAFGIFSASWRIPIILWSYLIFLSYSAYDTIPVQEHIILLWVEYGLVFFTAFLAYRNTRQYSI